MEEHIENRKKRKKEMPMKVTSREKLVTISSPAMIKGYLPLKYSYYGGNISPALEWKVPSGTKSLLLVFADIDADTNNGKFPLSGNILDDMAIHWIVHLSNRIGRINEGASPVNMPGAIELKNTFAECGESNQYCGPKLSQKEKPHRYVFALYALNVSNLSELGLGRKNNFQDFRKAIKDNQKAMIGMEIIICQFSIR